MNKQEIFKKLKQKYVLLQDRGYEVLFLALQGSQNYNLDIYTDEYKSDIDCMAIVLPSFDEFVYKKSEVNEMIELENKEHILVKDIGSMFNLWIKQNIQFLELLFTDYKIVNKTYKNLLDELFNMNEEVPFINRKSFYNSIIGVAMQKHVALEHPYPGIKDKIEKYGYDGKQLYQQIRLNNFIRNIDKGLSFKESLINYNDATLSLIMNAKLNKFDLQQAKMFDETYLKGTSQFKHKWDNISCKDNEEIINKLNDIKSKILKQYFRSQLIPEQCNEVNIEQYKNVYFISDTHFGHTNIIEYENRSIKMGIEGIMQHDDELIRRWNSVVKKNDLVFILGDFSFHKVPQTTEILKRLNGDKILIRGNHDLFVDNKLFDKTLFKEITTYKEICYKGQNICLMHYPIQNFKHMDKDIRPWVMLHGHIHSRSFIVPRHSYNVGADINNYTPIKLEDAVRLALSNNGNQLNGSIK